MRTTSDETPAAIFLACCRRTYCDISSSPLSSSSDTVGRKLDAEDRPDSSPDPGLSDGLVVDFDILPDAGTLILATTPRVERELLSVSAAAADARRGGAAVGTVLVLAVRISAALVLGRLAVLVDDDESELVPPTLARGAISDDVRAAAPRARPATAACLAESSATSELRRWIRGSWLVAAVAVRTEEVELSRIGSLELRDKLEIVDPAVVLLLLGIPDATSDSSRRLIVPVFSAPPASFTDDPRPADSAVVALCPRRDEPLSRLLALEVASPGEGSLLEVAELAALGALSACDGLDPATRC